MQPSLIYLLPELPDREHSETHWWLVANDEVIHSGASAEWLAHLANADGLTRRQIALAPAGSVRLSRSAVPASATTFKQAEGIASLTAIRSSLGEPETLHAVSEVDTADGQSIATAVVANDTMLAWLDWTAARGADPDAVIPVAALMPVSDHWIEASIGSQHLLTGRGLVIPNEPSLAAALAGPDDVEQLESDEVERLLVRGVAKQPLNLRTGRFARRRGLVIDRGRIRELAIIAASAAVLALLCGLVMLVKLDRSTDRLDGETVALAEAALGRPVSVENAESELRARVGGSGPGGFRPALTALYNAIQTDSAVSSTDLSYRPDGTLSVTLASAAVDNINRLLIALQRDGYSVTAVPRQSADGRSMVDVTVRSTP